MDSRDIQCELLKSDGREDQATSKNLTLCSLCSISSICSLRSRRHLTCSPSSACICAITKARLGIRFSGSKHALSACPVACFSARLKHARGPARLYCGRNFSPASTSDSHRHAANLCLAVVNTPSYAAAGLSTGAKGGTPLGPTMIGIGFGGAAATAGSLAVVATLAAAALVAASRVVVYTLYQTSAVEITQMHDVAAPERSTHHSVTATRTARRSAAALAPASAAAAAFEFRHSAQRGTERGQRAVEMGGDERRGAERSGEERRGAARSRWRGAWR